MHPQSTAEPMAQGTELVQQLVICLQTRPGSERRYALVSMTAGRLTLQGRTNTYYGQQLAEPAVLEFLCDYDCADQYEVL
jgi:hypothetical protein